MKTVSADEVRIPKAAREAVLSHEEVIVLNRDRPAFVIVNPEDYGDTQAGRRGRPLRDALAVLETAPLPDAAFGADMDEVLKAVGPMPSDPWAPS